MYEAFKKYSAFNGVATRSQYWGVALVTWAISMLVVFVSVLLMSVGPGGVILGGMIILVLVVLNFWVNLATMIRRCRDADINPWFVLAMLVPYVNFVVFIVFGCLPSKIQN